MKKTVRLLSVLMMMIALAVHSAGAESMIQINGDLAPKTAEEITQMVKKATDEYYQDQEIAEELRREISSEELTFEFFDDEKETITAYTLKHGGNEMRFSMEQKGEPDENGRYPLYIALHGGGEGEAADNDIQWFNMAKYYYSVSIVNGIYVACRGITNTWDLHFQPESYPLYDRLIQAMICLYHADPNRVYLLGYSAGGDGVYQIAPRMADRFAAANMSAGHPNSVSLRNLMNCPFSIQVGVRDYYSESVLRCIRAAEFEQVLNDYHDRLGYGYEHQVLVRVPNGHSFNDYSDDAVNKPTEEFWDTSEATVLANPTAYANPDVAGPMMTRFMEGFEVGGNRDVSSSSTEFTDISDLSYRPGYREFDEGILKIVTEEFHLELKTVNGSSVHYVSQFTRDPAPSVVVWDLSTRAPKRETTSFYWLRADYSVDRGEILVKAGDGNTITVTPENVNGDFSILIHPSLIDVSQPVHFIIPEGEVVVTVNPSEETLRNSIRETGDPCLAWVAEIPYSTLTAALQ